MAGGMDERLATHFAHLFIRDPIVIFSEDLKALDLSKADHFENLQSTNWQHMRFKPPPPDNNIGWRVEFRPMEIQVTDFENAAFAVFIVLITRAILSFNLNFYIPIAKVDENMETAHARDAVLHRRFHFRKNPFPGRRATAHARNSSTATTAATTANGAVNGSGSTSPSVFSSRPPTPPTGPVEDEYRPMTIDEIINGTPPPGPDGGDGDGSSGDDAFPGLIPLVESYLDSVNVDVQTRCELATYLDLIRRRASGELCTAARWIRDFVAAHPAYRRDSVVPDDIAHDLIGAVIAVGERECAGKGWKTLDIHGLDRLLGDFRGGCGGGG